MAKIIIVCLYLRLCCIVVLHKKPSGAVITWWKSSRHRHIIIFSNLKYMSMIFNTLETHATDMVFLVWKERWHETITLTWNDNSQNFIFWCMLQSYYKQVMRLAQVVPWHLTKRRTTKKSGRLLPVTVPQCGRIIEQTRPKKTIQFIIIIMHYHEILLHTYLLTIVLYGMYQ